ncbi:Chitinase 4 [Orchesella cincta]|uniref:Chitinase 4 n=1 Tax=Orchesella cincta TaxID=48709 RepID=A0A1D2ND93_ORCCI|nr:Chitinase 4 [Orchesella cincta]
MSSLLRRGDGRISFEEFSSAVTINGYPEPSHSTYWEFINSARNVSIFDKQELAMILAHFIYESKGFVERREEVDTASYPETYRDTECDSPGQLYFGRGYFKITGCKNYRDISMDLFNDDRLVRDPDFVAESEETAIKTGFSFWKTNVHTQPGVPDGQFGSTTNAIKGATECQGHDNAIAKRRFEIYEKVRSAFKLKGKANEGGCYELTEFLKAANTETKD